tara:strand:+ start:1009 stop:1758 length:750 start_codon:yes stop_codon:yes gene_type:complete
MFFEATSEVVKPVRKAISIGVIPILYIADFPHAANKFISESITSKKKLLDRNKSLEQQLLTASNESLQFQSLRMENEQLRELLGSQKRLAREVLIAELLSVIPTPNTHQIILDKGSMDQVYEGQAVIDSYGLLGQIIEVGYATSRVLLISDASHAVPIRINRNGIRSIASGTGMIDRLELENVPFSADIVEGDLAETSGLGGRFPPGYPVGYVDEIIVEPTASYAKVRVKPTALLDRSRHVLIVKEESE